MSEWISVKERLPGPFTPVVLLNLNVHESHIDYGDPMNKHYYDVAYLDNSFGVHWSIRGQEAISIKAYTHWMPLPPPPASAGKELK